MAQNRHQTVLRMILTVFIAHICLGFWFVERGLINGDEGWYLYAARQIGLGIEPYRDFAFFQPPVYPRFLAGILDSGAGSLISARWLSLLMLIMSTGLTALAAMRLAGPMGALIAITVVGLNPLVIGTSVLAKPYALAMLLVAGALFLLAAGDRVRNGLGFFFLGLAVGVRLSLLVPLLVWLIAQRRSRVVLSLVSGALGIIVAFSSTRGIAFEVLLDNWIGYHLGDEIDAASRLQWLVWQLGFCGFFLVGFLTRQPSSISGLHWAAAAGILIHILPEALHVEHTVIIMPMMAVAVAEQWANRLSRLHIVVGGFLWLISAGVGLRWVHLDQQTKTIQQTMDIGRWVAEQTDDSLPLLTTQLAIAVEANRSVCSGLEMSGFGWSPEMAGDEAVRLRRLNRLGLERCIHSLLGGVVLTADDFDRDARHLIIREASARFEDHRIIEKYGQFSTRLDIYLPTEGLMWTE